MASPLRALLPLLLAGALATPAAAQRVRTDRQDEAATEAARAQLAEAQFHYERGEWVQALQLFGQALESTPRRIRERDELHEGFLLYAYTLFLMGEPDLAKQKLSVALRLDPTHEPSPVKTRPDLLGFYNTEQDAWLSAHGDEPLDVADVFPDLAPAPVRGARLPPVLGLSLRQLGHAPEANLVLGLEVGFGVFNVGALIAKGALQNEASNPFVVNTLKPLLGWSTLVTFAGLWSTVVLDGVVSVALYERYRKHPELRPTPTPRRRPVRVSVGVGAVMVRW